MAAAANRLNDRRSKSHVIVLLTDGENNTGKIPPNTAAEAIKALKIHFYAIGARITELHVTPGDRGFFRAGHIDWIEFYVTDTASLELDFLDISSKFV